MGGEGTVFCARSLSGRARGQRQSKTGVQLAACVMKTKMDRTCDVKKCLSTFSPLLCRWFRGNKDEKNQVFGGRRENRGPL